MACAHYQLDNLCCILDRNNLQIDGTTSEVMEVAPLKEKYEAHHKVKYEDLALAADQPSLPAGDALARQVRGALGSTA